MRFIYIDILVAFLYSCSSAPPVPKGTLQPAKMETILLDMLRTDEYLNQYVISDSLNSKRKNFYYKVLQIHKVSKLNFQNSFYFYQAHPSMLKVILDSMHGKIQRPIAVKANDSLNKVQ